MNKRIAVLAAGAAILISAIPVFANNGKGGPNGTFIRFDGLDSYWKVAESGLLHEWRTTDNRHLVFKPADKFSEADCDEGYIASFLWSAHINYDQSYPFDEANLEDFLVVGDQYWVCIYEWSSDKPIHHPELVETLTVYANDSDGEDSDILESGKEYIFYASGTAYACNQPGCVIEFDAEYSTSDNSATPWVDGVAPPYDVHGADLLDLMVDGGFVNWGVYDSSHTYQMDYSGTGSSVNFTIYDIYYPNNTGSLTVDIYRMP